MKKILKQISTVVFAGSMLMGGAANAGIITNGGFESGDFEGWQQFGSADSNLVVPEPNFVRSGEFSAFFGQNGGIGGITQQFATTIGKTYSLTFWLGNMGASALNDDSVSFFSFSIDGAVQQESLLDNKLASDFTFYDVSFVAATELSALEFAFRQDEAYWFLDDVAVSVVGDAGGDPAPVPEPATLPLLFVAFAGWLLAGARRAGFNGSDK